MNRFVILIPSYKPDNHLPDVVEGMRAVGFSRFVVVDDGGGEEYASVFADVAKLPGVHLLTHEVNRGKGAALKTGFSFVRDQMPDVEFILTIDADGQHRPEDALKLVDASLADPNALVLGSRDFSLPNVPPKSRFGNRMTGGVFRVFCGLKIGDTQTGLRSIPCKHLDVFLPISGDRYEYETNMLLETKPQGIAIKEVCIETIYYDNNAASHFHPVRDSLRIYALIFSFGFRSLWRLGKFSLSSISSTVVDNVLFHFLHLYLFSVFGAFTEAICYVGARIVSSLLNFLLNRTVVFGSGSWRRAILRYYVVAVPQMLISAGTLTLLTHWFGVERSIYVTLIKLCVDLVLFIFSYRLQRDWVFQKEKKDEEK